MATNDNTNRPTEEVEVEVHSDAHDHDSDFTETDSKGGTTTRERNASNKKTQVIAFICGLALIALVGAFVYIKFFMHPTSAMPNNQQNSSVSSVKPNALEALTTPENQNVNKSNLPTAPVDQKPSVTSEPLPAPNALPAPTSTQAPTLPAPVQEAPVANAPVLPVAPNTSVDTANAGSQQDALNALTGAVPASNLPSSASSVPASASSSPALASSALGALPAPASASTASSLPASASSTSTPAVDSSQTAEDANNAKPNSQAIAILNQISDQIHGISDKVDAQDVKIATLEDRIKVLEDKKVAIKVNKDNSNYVTHKKHVDKDVNSVSLAKSDNSVELVSDKPVVPKKHYVAKEVKSDVAKSEPEVKDDEPKTITGTKIPGGECSGLSRGRVWIKHSDGSFNALGVGDKLGDNVISTVSLTDGVKAGNITYTCR